MKKNLRRTEATEGEIKKPLCIDLFSGLGGWSEGFLAEEYFCVGFDNGAAGIDLKSYPGQLVFQDILTLHGKQFKEATIIVASPPCQEFSYMAMPWARAKRLQYDYETGIRDRTKLTALFDACFRIQREASEAAGHKIPLIVENVRGAQKWVGRAKWNWGSYYLWGDVPALMPITTRFKRPGRNFHAFERGFPSFNGADHELRGVQVTKNNGGSWFAIAHNKASGHSKNPVNGGYKNARNWWSDGKGSLSATTSSHSKARKQASAMIAKIPFPLAQYIARVFK